MVCFGAIESDDRERSRRSRYNKKRKIDLSELSFEEQVIKANNRLLRMLNASEQSTAKVRAKLADAGFSDDVINSVISKAVEFGFVDDVRYCECLVRSALASGKGLERVKREVEALGVEITSLESYQAYENEGEESHIEDALKFLCIHPPRSKNMREAAFRKLLGRGYPVSVASSAARRYSEGCIESDMCSDIAL